VSNKLHYREGLQAAEERMTNLKPMKAKMLVSAGVVVMTPLTFLPLPAIPSSVIMQTWIAQ
jgi:hypothetical protein